MKASPARRLTWWLLGGEWRAHPIRTLVAIGAIAVGVALAFAIHLINAAAFNEFSAAAKSLSGQSDLQLRGAQPTFDESLYPSLAQRQGVEVASPVLEINAGVPGQDDPLKILALDVFRGAAISPDLIGVPAEERPFDALMDDSIFLSPAAMQWLNVKAGEQLQLRSGSGTVRLRVAGGLTRVRAGQRLAVMDIGAAQWHFDRVGQLSRIELKLSDGIDRDAFRKALSQELAGHLLVTETEDQEARTSNMSRAYRVNLNVLALVALFTGAFLVFSTQALSVIRRRQQFAFLRVIGWTRRQVLSQVLLEGAVLGTVGSAAGLAIGYGIAATTLSLFGGDLGGGYFPGIKPSVQFPPVAATVFFLAGSTVAILGAASPAWQAARAKPAPALKSGSEDAALSRLATPWPALACLILGAIFSQLPPVAGLPVFGYLSVALLLIGGIAMMPRLAALFFSMLGKWARGALPTLVVSRLGNAPNQASIALGGVLSSFSLMVAMAIMVASFRVSVDDWLSHILSAELYVRSSGSTETGVLKPEEQKAIAGIPGVARAEFLRVTQLTLDPEKPTVALVARPIDASDPGKTLPMVQEIPASSLQADSLPVWVSEAMVDLYGYRMGNRVRLPVGGKLHDFTVAGIWRDYARQAGAIMIRLPDYQRLSGDLTINDVSLWLEEGTSPAQVTEAVHRLPFSDTLEISEPGEIRAISLNIFDRSFAVTYLLEAVAIVIGLFGIAATFSAQTLARAKEFGMLRHVGVTRRQILGMLAAEGGLLTVMGILVGFVLGWCISLILVFVVNPQSFHWTMGLHMPWGLLVGVATVLLVSAGLTALVSGRFAVSGDAVRAVREDW
ncbi:FtsX-like permease family protein [Oxalobacteraceae bacterium R-40]|uniref:FtsX-like permease family protein n=1 Tax=Keguizhuia sedimenti TaxID=3064264 RepID=A0ABU1BSP0_9BURK|nr:FtsX-like permease family protein [Oxalobacteraceae bacterium R-40]